MALANPGSDTQHFSAGRAMGVNVLGCWLKLFPKKMFKVMSSAWASGSCYVMWFSNALQIKDCFPVLPTSENCADWLSLVGWHFLSCPIQSFSVNSSNRILFDILGAILRFPIYLWNKWRDLRGVTLDTERMKPGHPTLAMSVPTADRDIILSSPYPLSLGSNSALLSLTVQGAEVTIFAI